ncbi:MAG TPA: SDR family NAD(P)-dependent oxidoreductase, partial [Nitrososphaeraceae archaeon]|nr:SDR family NAD(P)-dependent oxidoreductase [Nitrososphaeraceae archaeon]
MPGYQDHNYSQNKNKKVAVITRAAKGVGKEICIEFARAGYSIMINDIAELELKRTVGEILSSLAPNTISRNMNNNISDYIDNVSYIPGDISKEEVSVSLIEETIKRFGRIDVLVNNATISQQSIASQSYEMSAAAPSANANTTNYQEVDQPSSYFTLEE